MNKVQKEIANVYQNILKLDEAMTDIRIVTGASVDEANSLMTSYNKLAKELGTTTTEVAKSASEWIRQGYGPLRMSVNVSPYQFQDELFVEKILHTLRETGVDPGCGKGIRAAPSAS